MPKTLRVLLCLAGIFLSGTARGTAEPESVVETYMKGVLSGEAAAAFEDLMKHSRLDELKPREIELVKGQIQQGFSLYGAPSGYELVAKKVYGESIVRLIYLTKHSDLPLVWNFFFYRAADSWQLLNFDFNDQLNSLD